MANGSGLKISVRADTAQAEQKLDEVERKADEVRKGAERAGVPGGTGAGGVGTATAGQAAPPPATPHGPTGVSGGSGGGATVGTSAAGAIGAGATDSGAVAPAKMADALGKNAGAAIAKYFVLQFGQQAASLAIEYTRKVGGGNRVQDYAQSTLGGVFTGAASAGALGFMVGGPVGAGIGIGVGALAGGLLGAGGEWIRQKRLREERERALKWGRFDSGFELEAGRANQAFETLLSTMGTEQQVDALRQRAASIRSGPGNVSVDWLGKRIAALEKNGKGDTDEYARLKELQDSQRRASNALELRAEGLESRTMLGALAGAYDRTGSGFVDQYAAQGINVGAMVDTADIQGDILSELRHIGRMLEKSAGNGAFSQQFAAANYGF